MQYFAIVTVFYAFQQLVSEPFDYSGVESLLFAETVHVLLEVVVQKFENQDQLAVGVDDFSQRYDIGMCQLFENGDLSDGCRGNAFFFAFESDLFESEDLASLLVCVMHVVPLAL